MKFSNLNLKENVWFLLLINISLVILSGVFVILAFLSGYYYKFLISIVAFCISTLFVVISTVSLILKNNMLKEHFDDKKLFSDIEINYSTINKIENLCKSHN